ncbi:hypothetical protein FQA39_LY14532 [Lamprigera yunnana]|nr:hypothetical protein FQA39_LY14532 [Lamprigera yunnana]
MKRSSYRDADFTKKACLVSRNPEPGGVSLVNSYVVGKHSRQDLIELASEIQKAENFIHANACNKLQVIAQQIHFLQQQAENILRETKLNQDLHHVSCNFVKVPGNTYHLYKKPDDLQYFSMLSPEEWQNSPHQYLGSFRLEYDRSWTPIQSMNQKDAEFAVINKILEQSNQHVNLFALQS